MASDTTGGELWVAFLRAINVSGRRVTNDALCDAVAACGCEAVGAYLASGNVILRDGRARKDLLAALEQGLASELGYPVPVFLRRADEVRAVVETEPFTAAELDASAGKRQVLFLREPVPADDLPDLQEMVPDDEVVVPIGTELHWLPRAGMSDSSLPMRALEELVGANTMRTHGAIQRLAARFL